MDKYIGNEHAASSTVAVIGGSDRLRKRALPAVAILSLQLVLFAGCGTSGANRSDASGGSVASAGSSASAGSARYSAGAWPSATSCSRAATA